MNKNERLSGILMPISSLPSPYGIGTLGKASYDFADFLKACHVKIWQMLPLNVTSYGDSPYQSPSSTGLNYYFIDLDILIEKGLLTKEECEDAHLFYDERRVDYGSLFARRIPLLKKAFSRFDHSDPDFLEFVKEGKYNDFAFFMTMKTINSFHAWYQWSDEYRNYTPELEARIKKEHAETYLFFVWTQFEFLAEFKKLKAYVNSLGIQLIGDMPLYLAYDSVEAYKYPELFLFDSKHNPTVVAGCPPDYFSKDGQLWGNPIYNYANMKEDNYAWFSRRIALNLEIYDILRIDHFRGCSSYYTIPFGMKNARIGRWVDAPGIALFQDKKELPIIAEDLGTLDEGVYKLLAETGFPGMKVLEFAFDGDPNNPHKPHLSPVNSVSYTGTHDNMPLRGYLEFLSEQELTVFKRDVEEECKLLHVNYLDSTLKELVNTVVSLSLASPSFISVIPYQDYLASGKESRINLPSSLSNANWTYRFLKDEFNNEVQSRISRLISAYNR